MELSRIRLLALDFDGVFTDNKVHINAKGEEWVTCNKSDSSGLEEVRKLGVKVVIISSEKKGYVKSRAKKLGISLLYSPWIDKSKGDLLRQYADGYGICLLDTVYIGNDLNDAPALKIVGHPIIVQDAHPSIFNFATYVTQANGGYGAIREVCDKIIFDKTLLRH